MSYDINSNILSKTGYSAQQLKDAERAFSPGNGYSDEVYQGIVDAENKYGINALFTLAHADVESAHGNSYYARTRNNLFGFNAIDSDPDQASSYPSEAASIDFYANFLKTHYLSPNGVYFNGATPHGVFVKYSSSHDAEANTVVQIMNALESKISGSATPNPTPAPAPAQPANPAEGTYHVPSGREGFLSVIASKYPGTTVDMWVNTNKAKYPRITRDYVQAGWDLNIPGGSPAQAAPKDDPKYRTAQPGDTVWAWGFRPPYDDFKALNPGVDPEKIYAGQTYRVA
jgi:hypothetical protein